MRVLTKSQIIRLHKDLITESGGSSEIRDDGLLDSAINAPFQSFGGAELYPSVLEKASRLGFGLIKNHPFVDGNKRIGTHVMIVFLALNHIELVYEDKELIDLILNIASGSKNEKHLLNWLQNHIA
ncbi:MAG: type II toxin-antitoxin system death-on-curing family toxin [Ruminococcus sp.]|nr:type II toxin-antitoxin system death-on-curing family toxin [Ruminococcus sp.]